MSRKISTSTRQAAKEAGLMDQLFLCRKHVAVLFEPAWGIPLQAVPVILNPFDLLSALGSQKAPANAAGFLRSALSAEAKSSGFSKPMRRLTEHKKTS